jgi:hypothetical protein
MRTARWAGFYPKVSTGRRLGLARWITSPENPLTARVAVNHIWTRHFGKPLVPSVIDFGKNGKMPTNPALLDWLATEFVNSGWSHEEAASVDSHQPGLPHGFGCASANHHNLKTDPNNIALWRMNPRRLEAEAIRDSVLAVCGCARPHLWEGPELHEEKDQDVPRRSLYFTSRLMRSSCSSKCSMASTPRRATCEASRSSHSKRWPGQQQIELR